MVPFTAYMFLGLSLLSCIDAMEPRLQSSKIIGIREYEQTHLATTVQPSVTPQYNCDKPEETWEPNTGFMKTIAESFCNDEKVFYGVVQPGESVEVKLDDTDDKLIHSVSISWLPGCALKSQVCDSRREGDGCKHWINEIIKECQLSGNCMNRSAH